jgi:hypothetical protein
MLPEIAILPRIDLSGCIIQKTVLQECAELRTPTVITARNYLPRKIRVVSAAARIQYSRGRVDFSIGRFRIIGAYAGTGIWLKRPSANLSMKFPINAPVLIQVLTSPLRLAKRIGARQPGVPPQTSIISPTLK